jgi:hypothetical protein
MKIVIDVGGGKSCWNCEHLVRNLPVSGFQYGIPVVPTCLVFRKQVQIKKKGGVAVRLAECLEAELEMRKLERREQ